ncbi:MAG: ribulose-phosphate 3-epimerase [bacterium]|nr:ribulose-phosphate 3-epimerase [bacterium]
MAKIAPSILGADFSRLGDEIASCEQAGISIYHLDIMDGHFVPNISFGPGVVKTVDRLTDHLLDVHLMLSEPEKYFEPFAKAGADYITFHLEVHPDPTKYAEQLRQLGIKPGISINPDMPVEKVLPFLEHFDLLLLMSVFPGFGGQSYIESVTPKIAAARDYVDHHHLHTQIEVDGGIDRNNARKVVEAGADLLVMGTGFFGVTERKSLVNEIERIPARPSRK